MFLFDGREFLFDVREFLFDVREFHPAYMTGRVFKWFRVLL
jgi:hypothetical protein